MGPSKKHPLEIFRSIAQDSAEKPVDLPRPGVRGRRKSPGRSRERGSRVLRSSRERPLPEEDLDGNGRRSPGDFTVTLTLNQVLLSLLVAAVLVLGGYFAGYFRGASGAEGIRLEAEKGKTGGTFSLREPERSPSLAGRTPSRENRNARAPSALPARGVKRRYGALIATYDESREDIVDRTIEILAERGFKKENIFKVLYKKDKKYAILIGSYDRMDHPDLKRLLERVRSIDDFPGGGKRPFRSAYIVKFPVTRN